MTYTLFYNKNIYKINKISFYIVSLLAILFIFIALITTYNDYIKDVNKLEKDYFNSQKIFIKKETQRALSFINYKYNKDRKNKSLLALQEEIIDAIEQMRNKNNGSGYVFIYDFNGINIADPIFKKNAGKNLIDFSDPNGKKVIKELINISIKKEGGYVKYVWNKPTTNTLEAKISYANSFKPWNWMVGSGVYLDEIQKVIKQRKHLYKQKVLSYVLQILFISIVLLIAGTLIYKYFTSLIQKDIKIIIDTLHKIDLIDYEQLTFDEFKTVSKNINNMTKELKYLNASLEEKVQSRTKKLQSSQEYALQLVQNQDIFIKNAIHEINTPLSIMIANIDLFKLRYSHNQYLNKIEAASKIIHNIYNDLSYLIKKDRITYEKEIINFSDFLISRIDFFDSIAIGNMLTIKTNIQENININFNDIQLQRICDNSISNAINYSYQNTSINISLKIKNNLILFEIINQSDTIKNTQEVFKRYYRENTLTEGFGMGLDIINEICDKTNVQIDLSSKENITSFTYTFKD